LAPELESPWLARAECDLERNDARKAVEHASRAAVLAPRDAEATLLLATAMERSGDAIGARRWRRGLALDWDRPPRRIPGSETRADARAALELALDREDAAEVSRAAVRARVGSAELSLRTVARGRVELTNELASTVLEAEPGNSDARIAALSVADLTKDDGAFRRFLATVPKSATVPSPLGADIMAALLSRRIGADAAKAWSSAYRSVTAAPPP